MFPLSANCQLCRLSLWRRVGGGMELGGLWLAMVLLEYQSFDPINVGLKVGIVLCSSSSPAAAARSDRSHKQIMIITGHNTTQQHNIHSSFNIKISAVVNKMLSLSLCIMQETAPCFALALQISGCSFM